MAKNNSKPETYRGRRRKLNVLGIVLSAVAVLIVVLFVLFGSFQKYIVYGNNGISIEHAHPAPRPARRRTRASAFSSR